VKLAGFFPASSAVRWFGSAATSARSPLTRGLRSSPKWVFVMRGLRHSLVLAVSTGPRACRTVPCSKCHGGRGRPGNPRRAAPGTPIPGPGRIRVRVGKRPGSRFPIPGQSGIGKSPEKSLELEHAATEALVVACTIHKGPGGGLPATLMRLPVGASHVAVGWQEDCY
jgi:hypothetical protein